MRLLLKPKFSHINGMDHVFTMIPSLKGSTSDDLRELNNLLCEFFGGLAKRKSPVGRWKKQGI